MMEYENFKATVLSLLPSYMPEDFHDMRITVNRVTKINQQEDALICIIPNENASVMLYFSDLYSHYQRIGNLTNALIWISSMVVHAFRNKPQYVCREKILGDVKEKIIFQLIKTDWNQELLKDAPHRNFLDMSIIYKIVVDMSDNLKTTLVTNAVAQSIDMTEDQLFQCAFQNTRTILPPVIVNITAHFAETDSELTDVPDDKALWMIGNQYGTFGAATILYKDILATAAERIGSDLYLLPSSVHEFLACTTKDSDPSVLLDLVRETNMQQVAAKDRLSDRIYHYLKETGKITIVTDACMKPEYFETGSHVSNYWKS